MPEKPKYRVLEYCVMTTLFWFSNYSFVPYLALRGNLYTENTVLVGIMLGSYGFAQLLLRIPIGILADRYNNRRFFIRMGCVSSAVAAVGLFFAPNIYVMILCRFISGAAVSVWVPMTVLFASIHAPGNSVRSLTLLNGCNYLGQFLSAILAIPVAARYGIGAAFMLAAAAAAPSIVLSFRLEETPLNRPPLSVDELLRIGRTKWVLAISVCGILCQLMTYTSVGYVPLLAAMLGLDPNSTAITQAIFTLGSFTFSLLATRLFVSRFGCRNSLIGTLTLQVIMLSIQPLAPSLVFLCMMIFVNGIACGVSMSLMIGLVVLPFPYEKQSTAMGFYQAIYGLGMLSGPVLVGLVMQRFSLATAFQTSAAIGIAAPAVAFLFLQDERKTPPCENTSI